MASRCVVPMKLMNLSMDHSRSKIAKIFLITNHQKWPPLRCASDFLNWSAIGRSNWYVKISWNNSDPKFKMAASWKSIVDVSSQAFLKYKMAAKTTMLNICIRPVLQNHIAVTLGRLVDNCRSDKWGLNTCGGVSGVCMCHFIFVCKEMQNHHCCFFPYNFHCIGGSRNQTWLNKWLLTYVIEVIVQEKWIRLAALYQVTHIWYCNRLHILVTLSYGGFV